MIPGDSIQEDLSGALWYPPRGTASKYTTDFHLRSAHAIFALVPANCAPALQYPFWNTACNIAFLDATQPESAIHVFQSSLCSGMNTF